MENVSGFENVLTHEVPRKGPKPGYKAPIKYRGPNGETWSGRGKTPKWITASGKDKEAFKSA